MRSLLLIMPLACLLFTGAIGAQAYDSPPPVDVNRASADFTSYTLPAGSALHVVLQSPVDTAANQAGDPVEAAVAQNVYLGEHLLISRDDRLRGRITQLLTPIQGRNAILEVRFTDLVLTNGEVLPLSAYVKTPRPDHKWGGEVTPGTKVKTVTHRVWDIGQYNQTVLVGPRQMGQNIELLPGEYWTVILDQPVTLVKPRTEEDPDL